MKVIHDDNIISVSASEADGNYPVSNIQTDYRTQLWKGTAAVTQVAWESGVSWEDGVSWEVPGSLPYIELTVGGVEFGKDMALAIINTNATRVDITVTASNGDLVLDEVSYYTEGDFDIKDLWVDYTAQEDTHTIKLEFLPPVGEVAECGSVCVGESLEFRNPKYGLNENLEDTSIMKVLNNGATYYKKRTLLRNFSGSLILDRDDDFYEFMYRLIRANGRVPLAWLLTDDLEDRRWTVFGRPDMPSGSHDYYQHSTIGFKIEEGL